MGAAPGVRTRVLSASDWEVPILREMWKNLQRFETSEQLTSSRRIMTVNFRLSLLRCSSGLDQDTITIVLPLLP